MFKYIFNIYLVTVLFYTQAGWCAEKQPVLKTASLSNILNEDAKAWDRDPFIGKLAKKRAVPLTSKLNGYKATKQVENEEEINLQGIIQSDNTYHALINGRALKTGDMIGTTRIQQINRYQVVLQNAKKEKIVYDIYQGKLDKDRGKK
ncbi:MAG: hypothetical protein PHN84_01690 [Desulfuromonadaceae bacterium]|nr:hypothetical protein [Desulfuromonadaceae bacterium]MDD2854931.1 hypothetical protein [Desulfuromonadaceae bacterium]